MLFRSAELEEIRSGRVTAAVRRWRRPTVRAGGTLTTPIGMLDILEVRRTDPTALSDDDARAAGFRSAADALGSPAVDRDGDLYLVRFALAGPDPRIALRAQDHLDDAELAGVLERLGRMDARSAGGPWTMATLALIRDHPGERAADLAARLGRTTAPFKVDVRKLKGLGLTESLEVGYRLSPRGVVVLAAGPSG